MLWRQRIVFDDDESVSNDHDPRVGWPWKLTLEGGTEDDWSIGVAFSRRVLRAHR